jgi:hypothetical protein
LHFISFFISTFLQGHQLKQASIGCLIYAKLRKCKREIAGDEQEIEEIDSLNLSWVC